MIKIENIKHSRYSKYKNSNLLKIPVTVCIATIYNNNSILAVSDRMVTGGYGDTTFQPPIRKIFGLTTSIAVLTAGDHSIQFQVYDKTLKILKGRIATEPDKWIEVGEAAKIYANCFIEVRNETIERSVLSRYGLDFDSFIKKQIDMKDIFIEEINKEIEEFSRNFGRIATLIIGVDDSGPHIYVVEGETINCHDKIGFASVGIGASHAMSHLMLSAYSRFASEADSLLAIHQAKKKAEVSPGVGNATDMCIIGPAKGSFNYIDSPPKKEGLKDIIKDLDNFYKEYVDNIEKIDQQTKEKIQKYLDNLVPKEPQEQKISETDAAEKPKDEEKL